MLSRSSFHFSSFRFNKSEWDSKTYKEDTVHEYTVYAGKCTLNVTENIENYTYRLTPPSLRLILTPPSTSLNSKFRNHCASFGFS